MFRKLLLFFSMFLLLLFSSTTTCADERTYPAPATVDISAIRSIDCDNYIGTGFLIGPKILVTALHVAIDTNCRDGDTGGRLTIYKIDREHDLALMTGSTLPIDIPYIKYSCTRFTAKQPYLSWGRTFYGMQHDTIISRMNVIVAGSNYTQPGDTLDDGTPADGMRYFDGVIAPGMSGGPITNLGGVAMALNNAGSDTDTIVYEFADGMLCNK